MIKVLLKSKTATARNCKRQENQLIKSLKLAGIFFFFFALSTIAFSQSAPVKDLKAAIKQDKNWFSGPEASRIADNVLLYQHENGGWHKNINMTDLLTEKQKEQIKQEKAAGGTTIDNGATVTQLRFLHVIYLNTNNDIYKSAFLKGIEFLLKAQYANGGWPQYYPIKKGYYEHITFNDGAMIGVMRLLREIGQNKPEYSYVPAVTRISAAQAVEKGLVVILKSQINQDGKLTAWCAQIDKQTLAPAKARAYELPSISGGESVEIVRYLMELEQQTPEIKKAIESAITWYQNVKITGIKLTQKKDAALPKGYDLIVEKDAAAPPIWARFYDIKTNQPMFVGRDGVVQTDISKIEYERRNGYAYYVDIPQGLLEVAYPKWVAKWAKK